MTRGAWSAAGLLVLAAAWLGPLPAMSRYSFAAHMTMHVSVIAIAVPLLALGMRGSLQDPVRRFPRLFSPIPASLFELVVVWAWHAPLLHHLARESNAMLALEQSSFFLAGMLVWMSSFGGSRVQQRTRAMAGVAGLLLTSMHMTLLGVLLALADRSLYAHVDASTDQQLGGVIMLCVGGAAYLLGALYRIHELLLERCDAVSPG